VSTCVEEEQKVYYYISGMYLYIENNSIVSLSLTLNKNNKIKYHIKENTYKLNVWDFLLKIVSNTLYINLCHIYITSP